MKICTNCKTEKHSGDFHSRKKSRDGLSSRCKERIRNYGRNYRFANNDKVKASRSKYESQNKERIKAYRKQWTKDNSEYVRDYARKYRKQNAARLNAQVRARTDYKEYYERNGRKCHLKKKYGITIEEYDRLFALQDGKCAICQTDDPGKGKRHFHIDHDHLSGKVRGLLCVKCNMGIGSFDEDTHLMMTAATYILHHREGCDPYDYEG